MRLLLLLLFHQDRLVVFFRVAPTHFSGILGSRAESKFSPCISNIAGTPVSSGVHLVGIEE